MNKKLSFISIFAGAGGLSEGFIRNGYIPIAHVEKDQDACLTLKTRLAYHYLKKTNQIDYYNDYLLGKIDLEKLYNQVPSKIITSVLNHEISKKSLKLIFNEIESILKLSKKNTIDIIIGGPPCQAYSLAGRSADKNRKRNDPRNYLYKDYAKFLIEFEPKLFVFENVPGLYTANDGLYYKNLKKYFRRIGYQVESTLLDAADFEVVQRRKRILIIGWRKDLGFTFPEFKKVENKWTVDDLLSDLPFLKAGQVLKRAKYRKRINKYLKKSEIRNGFDHVTQNITRPHNNKDLKIYKRAIELWKNEHKRLKNSEIPKKERTQKNVTSFLDRFKIVAGDELSHTMIAHIAKDGHHYIHPDKKQLRSISVREAARIQSFPDDYFFEGSRTSVFKQIGNAVPPLMADTIAKKLKDILVYE
jgi:DNA (cytosine-5)-methyltransferase 1